jgi:hypothetical protein
MDTNIKVVGFANQSINGINVNNEGFDLEYDGKLLNLSGFSGDKLYSAKLNNQQIVDLLQRQSSQIPLEKRIMMHREKRIKPHFAKSKKYSRKNIKNQKKSKYHKLRKSYKSKSKSNVSHLRYKSPKMRSEF